MTIARRLAAEWRSMTTPLLIPLEGGFGHHHHHHLTALPWGAGDPSSTIASGAVPPFAPFLGGLMFFLFMLLVLGTVVVLPGSARPLRIPIFGRQPLARERGQKDPCRAFCAR